MKKKQEKLLRLSDEHREALAKLGALPEFAALEKLFRIEEQNIIIHSFKVNSGDPAIAIKKSWDEGRIWELRKVLATFQEVKKGKDESE